MRTRGVTAMTGAFGYELDLGKLSEGEKQQVKEQIARYHKAAPLLLNGRYYRLSNPFMEECGAWMVVDARKECALLSVVVLEIHGNMPVIYVKLQGLEEEGEYQDEETGKRYSGAALMAYGMPIALKFGEYQAYQILFSKIPLSASDQ